MVLNDTGRTIAMAKGLPPDWITDIPGAEAWALLQAAVGAEPGCKTRIDRLPCVDAFEAGLAWATTDKRKHARAHAMMLKAWGDVAAGTITWMPAHCTED